VSGGVPRRVRFRSGRNWKSAKGKIELKLFEASQKPHLRHLPCRVFEENSLALQMHEEFASAEVFKDEVELSAGLESVDQFDDEWMLVGEIQIA
jgi:hypothetical protein